PGNNGGDCDTFNTCTKGTCNQGTCQKTPRTNGIACEPDNTCLNKNGTCQAGECTAAALNDGAPCRKGPLGDCVTGTCMTFGPITFCSPEFKCDAPDACDFHCNFVTGN